MSLQVWLPLNGNLNNQGLSNVVVTNNGAIVDNNGKIGKCYEFSSNKRISISKPMELIETNEASISCWAYISSWNSSYDSLIALSVGTSWNDTRLALVRNNTSNKIIFCVSDGNISNRVTTLNDFPLNEWAHIVGTFDGMQLKIYVNGILNNSSSSTIPKIIYGNSNINIGSWSNAFNYPINGKLNDVRIYDHCLSKKEVAEVAKGLCLHYKLTSSSGNKSKNLISANDSEILWDKTKTSYSGKTWSVNTSRLEEIVGKTLTYSFEIYRPSGMVEQLTTNTSLQNRFGGHGSASWKNSSTGATTVTYPLINLTSIADTKKRVSVTQTINCPSGYDTLTGVSVNFQCYCKPTGNEVWELRNPLLEIGSTMTTYEPGSENGEYSLLGFDSNIEYDCSGFEHHGTKIGNLQCETDSARFLTSLNHLDSCADYIITDELKMLPYGATFSCWIRQKSYSRTSSGTTGSGNQFIMSQGRDYFAGDSTYGFNLISTNGTIRLLSGTSAINSDVKVDLNKWYFLTATFDGSQAKLYINGELKKTANSSIDFVNTGGKFTIGKMSYNASGTTTYFPFVGNISDARVYATPLSADVIKELYEVGASAAKGDTIWAYEFIE